MLELTKWPSRAVVTAGMPYGNKGLHFGHIGGVFVPADVFARFLRDRIGAENVRFVCGTDCFGSPIDEGYRKAVASGEFDGTISEYVQKNHDSQASTLKAYGISLDIYEGSAIGHAGEVHQALSEAFIEGLYERGHLSLDETLQFYDTEAKMFLAGRQVLGKCPYSGCKSTKAYADECELGHQYAPEDLIDPVSSVTGTTPEMRLQRNWYFDLPDFQDFLEDYVRRLQADDSVRDIVWQTISEFLVPPSIFIRCEYLDAYRAVAPSLPEHEYIQATGNRQSFEIVFDALGHREEAVSQLQHAHIRFRTSKTLVPFRITGNVDWGVRAPVIEGVEGLSVWCWPESLWAPISFTIARNDELGLCEDSWQDFWCSDDACVYQFIGQDNLYFYGVAQTAMWQALGVRGVFGGEGSLPLRQSRLIANYHLLFGSSKASSSGDAKPPTGEELLAHYTPEQLRAHFLSLGLGQKPVKFKPKPFDPELDDEQRSDPRRSDPVMKEGMLLTNVFNRLARSCFYEASKNFNCEMPLGSVGGEVVEKALDALRKYDLLMQKSELHSVMQLCDEFIRYANRYWTEGISSAGADDMDARKEVMRDSFYLLRVCALMMHPIAPDGCNLICEKMRMDGTRFFSWDFDFLSNDELCDEDESSAGAHQVEELPPRFDFFPRHPSQK